MSKFEIRSVFLFLSSSYLFIHSFGHWSLLFPFRILSHFYVGSMFLMRRLHLTLSCPSSTVNSLSDMAFLMLSNHHRYGLPLLLFRGTSKAITLLYSGVFSINYLSVISLSLSLCFCLSLSFSSLCLSLSLSPSSPLSISFRFTWMLW